MSVEKYTSNIFRVDVEEKIADKIVKKKLEDMGIEENKDLQKWVVENPNILGEELLVIANEYSEFVNIRKRPDILALDSDGKLVVVELKRDEADTTTDWQATEYAGYCSILTAEEIQKDYRKFRKENGKELSPEEVVDDFGEHLGEDFEDKGRVTEGGWADFELDNKPRILLAAGSFPTEVTSPVMWLRQEYGLEITCVTVHAYEHGDELLLNTRQMIPPPEAEEYMAQRQAKKRKQEESGREPNTFKVLMDRDVLKKDDIIEFDKKEKYLNGDYEYCPEDGDFWKARVTGKRGQSNNFEWLHDGKEYSISDMTETMISKLRGEKVTSRQGPKFWNHPDFENKTLLKIKELGLDSSDRSSE